MVNKLQMYRGRLVCPNGIKLYHPPTDSTIDLPCDDLWCRNGCPERRCQTLVREFQNNYKEVERQSIRIEPLYLITFTLDDVPVKEVDYRYLLDYVRRQFRRRFGADLDFLGVPAVQPRGRRSFHYHLVAHLPYRTVINHGTDVGHDAVHPNHFVLDDGSLSCGCDYNDWEGRARFYSEPIPPTQMTSLLFESSFREFLHNAIKNHNKKYPTFTIPFHRNTFHFQRQQGFNALGATVAYVVRHAFNLREAYPREPGQHRYQCSGRYFQRLKARCLSVDSSKWEYKGRMYNARPNPPMVWTTDWSTVLVDSDFDFDGEVCYDDYDVSASHEPPDTPAPQFDKLLAGVI